MADTEQHPDQLLHLVFGGELTSLDKVHFKDLDKLDVVGIYPNYATAKRAWEEKARAGDSLVPADPQHRYNLPEGLRYDYQGEGLLPAESADVPFADNPLEGLNSGGLGQGGKP